jgi:hypothetical protein
LEGASPDETKIILGELREGASCVLCKRPHFF